MTALTAPLLPRSRGVAAALLLSLLAHGALLWLSKPGGRPDAAAAPPLRIQLRPPAPANAASQAGATLRRPPRP